MQRAVAGTGAALLLSLAQASHQGASGPVLLRSHTLDNEAGWSGDGQGTQGSMAAITIPVPTSSASCAPYSGVWESILSGSPHHAWSRGSCREQLSPVSREHDHTLCGMTLTQDGSGAAMHFMLDAARKCALVRNRWLCRLSGGGGDAGRKPSGASLHGKRRPSAAAQAPRRSRPEQEQSRSSQGNHGKVGVSDMDDSEEDEEDEEDEDDEEDWGAGAACNDAKGKPRGSGTFSIAAQRSRGQAKSPGKSGRTGARGWEDDGVDDMLEDDDMGGYGDAGYFDDDDEEDDDDEGFLEEDPSYRPGARRGGRPVDPDEDDYYLDDDDYDYDDDLDEDEDEDDDERYRRGARGAGRGFQRQRGAPGGRRGGRGGPGRMAGPGRGSGSRGRRPREVPTMQRMKDRFFMMQEELKSTMSEVSQRSAKVLREIKGSISSDLEKTLIKATRPDSDPAKRKHVNLLLQAAEHAFPIYMNPDDPNLAGWKEGPYWMTLHKLWRRMAEKDYRTTAKALYVLHRLARGTSAESWGYFRMTIADMRREEDKGTKCRYFFRRVISSVDDEGEPFAAWLGRYADFVLMRMQTFDSELSELANVDAGTAHPDAWKVMEKFVVTHHTEVASMGVLRMTVLRGASAPAGLGGEPQEEFLPSLSASSALPNHRPPLIDRTCSRGWPLLLPLPAAAASEDES